MIALDLADAPSEVSFAGLIEVRREGPYCTKCGLQMRMIGGHLIRKHGFPSSTRLRERLILLDLPAGSRMWADSLRQKQVDANRQRKSAEPMWRVPVRRHGWLGMTGIKRSASQKAVARAASKVSAAIKHTRAMYALTCEHCKFTVCVPGIRVRGGQRFCSKRCGVRARHVASRSASRAKPST